MATQRILEKFSERLLYCTSKLSSNKVKETIREYFWNCPTGFTKFSRLARLAELKAPDFVLAMEVRRMEGYFKRDGIAQNEVARIKEILFEAYPSIKRAIKRIPLVATVEPKTLGTA